MKLATVALAAATVVSPAAALAQGKSGTAPNQSAQGAASSSQGQATAQAAGNPCQPNPKGPSSVKGRECAPVSPGPRRR
jgi:hypothetical protein